MYRIKSFVSSFTLLFTLLQVLLLLFLTAKLFLLLGLVGGWLYPLYESNNLLFWVVWVVSRVVYAALMVCVNVEVFEFLKQHSWYWTKPDESPTFKDAATDDHDKSWIVIGAIVIFCVVLIISEVALSVFTGIVSPFLIAP